MPGIRLGHERLYWGIADHLNRTSLHMISHVNFQHSCNMNTVQYRQQMCNVSGPCLIV